jgi:GNAT superfamily N-acetyltransferase
VILRRRRSGHFFNVAEQSGIDWFTMASASFELIAVVAETHKAQARELISKYLHWVAEVAQAHYGLSFDVKSMVMSDVEDQTKFYPPTGRFYLVEQQGQAVGVGCLKKLAPGVGEVQRMYLQPHARGVGAGRALMEQLVEDARTLGYQSLRLESLNVLEAAHTLYRSIGFRDIAPYSESSMQSCQSPESLATYRESAVFLELMLGSDVP